MLIAVERMLLLRNKVFLFVLFEIQFNPFQSTTRATEQVADISVYVQRITDRDIVMICSYIELSSTAKGNRLFNTRSA